MIIHVIFSYCRILRECSIIFLHFPFLVQEPSEEQKKNFTYILPVILQEYCQSYVVVVNGYNIFG